MEAIDGRPVLPHRNDSLHQGLRRMIFGEWNRQSFAWWLRTPSQGTLYISGSIWCSQGQASEVVKLKKRIHPGSGIDTCHWSFAPNVIHWRDDESKSDYEDISDSGWWVVTPLTMTMMQKMPSHIPLVMGLCAFSMELSLLRIWYETRYIILTWATKLA